MNFKNISDGMRLAIDLAGAGDRLLRSMENSRRTTGWPLVIGMGIGVGIGALIFSNDARTRVKSWLMTDTTKRPEANEAPTAAPNSAIDAANELPIRNAPRPS